MSLKVIGGAMGGVLVPIVIEYAVQGKDISANIPIKWSGIAGIAIGAVPIVLVIAKVGPFFNMNQENKDAILAFGAASLATGISILVLEQLRRATTYSFRGNVPMNPPMMQGLPAMQGYTAPVGQVIKEI